jgi:hypothetical protein
MNRHHGFFLERLFHGDKMTFHFGFAFTGQNYGMVPFAPASLGVQAPDSQSQHKAFCGNTLAQVSTSPDGGPHIHKKWSQSAAAASPWNAVAAHPMALELAPPQKHPDKDRIVFLHRNSAKFKDASSYFMEGEPRRVWTHTCQQVGEAHAPAAADSARMESRACSSQGLRGAYNIVFRGELPDTFFAGSDAGTHYECLTPITATASVKPSPTAILDAEADALRFLAELRELPFYPGYRQCNDRNRFFCTHA